jgi:hypothetical protein
MSFAQTLQIGLAGEGRISRWLNKRGLTVLPAYEVELNHGKGPRLFAPGRKLICPDLLAFNAEKIIWFEAKTKTAFTWHRLTGSWQTGIDLRHWKEYLAVNVVTPFPVWLLFLHEANGSAKDTPVGLVSPSGLFGNEIGVLARAVDHESQNHGPSGMVYWRISALKKIAGINEIPEC